MTNPPAGIALAASRTAVPTPRGWNAIVDVSVTRTGSFTGAVALSIEGLPPGVTASFAAASLAALATNTRLNIEVDSGAAFGTYPLTIRGTGTGVNAASVAISLIVPRPEFQLQIAPTVAYRTVPFLGLTATISVAASRGLGFSFPVSLNVDVLPTGVTLGGSLTIGPEQNTTAVILLIGPTATAGSYPIVIRATAPEADPRSGSVSVVIPGP
ncbi:MAG: hypothetical protein ABMA00_16680 [Gemmatimonas sp.]